MTTANYTATTDTRVYIGTASSASTKADFEKVSWVEIGGISDIGEFGDEREEITLELYGEGRRIKRSGVRDAGNLTLEVAFDALDPGQQVARDGFDPGKTHPFKVVMADTPPEGGTPTTIYALGVILSTRNTFGGPNNAVMQTFNASLTSAPIVVLAKKAA